MNNPYELLQTFSLWRASCAIAGFVSLENQKEADHARIIFSALVRDAESGILPCELEWTPIKSAQNLYNPFGEPPPPPRRTVDWGRTTVTRADLLTWCESRGSRPPLLFPDPPPDDKPLHARERETLLAIIRALATKWEIDPAPDGRGDGWHGAADKLLRDFSKSPTPIYPPCKVDALEKHLRAAFLQDQI